MENVTVEEIMKSYQVRFLKDKAEGKTLCIQFDISGEGGKAFTLQIQNGTLETIEGLEGNADCVMSATAENYIQLETGVLNPVTAMFTGKVKASNMLKVTEFTSLFRGFVSVKNEGLI
ncbi:SCP2 sterol-binding domain-containing protein [Sediminitomix flava]|uniref:Putative sterol carrier protein n=1 Tax=Sediminitomix flava TaxID=379075 RepID=A0A315ZBL5_SEDFL|nr:SCP2 sterol-binding domain-containing protein [Sediminitomix flava]PWJ42549.1 putative sterol carrier protein [Sediminitomix flava]